jgi:hypothetical protein
MARDLHLPDLLVRGRAVAVFGVIGQSWNDRQKRCTLTNSQQMQGCKPQIKTFCFNTLHNQDFVPLHHQAEIVRLFFAGHHT